MPVSNPQNKEQFSFGRAYSFLLLIIMGGLLQIWVVSLILIAQGKTIDLLHLLGDGGLFFFSTSLAYSSVFSLADKRHLSIGNIDFNITCTFVGLISLLSTIIYVTVIVSNLSTGSMSNQINYAFSKYIVHQISCVFMALTYAFYVAVRTGLFRRAT